MTVVRDGLARLFGQHHLLTTAVYIAAFICVCIFPAFDRKTEVEEHALTAAYGTAGFTGEWGRTLKATIKQLEAAPDIGPGLDEALAAADLPSHRLNITSSGGLPSSLYYTVAGSRRGDSREAVVVVLACNWTSGSRTMQRAAQSLGIGVTFAQYLKTVQWLSKDVIVVFVDNSLPYGAGIRAWLETYFGGSSNVRRGVLRQAVVLDTPSQPKSLLIEAEGINGMVPNQDIVNTYMRNALGIRNFPVRHRDVWESVYHTFRNGGVHSSHAPFLELHVPAFTIKGQRSASEKGAAVDPEMLVQSIEGVVRSMSSVLQQLHHSFNFYFFTGLNSHISNGLYLYPVFGMQLPLLSFLWTTPAFRDIRSFLVGLGAIAATVVASGSPIFLLATNADLRDWLGRSAPSLAAELPKPPVCLHPAKSAQDAEIRRQAAVVWLAAGASGVVLLAIILRQFAFRLHKEGQDKKALAAGCANKEDGGVRLPSPLWDAIRCASGFAALVTLAPITIYSWAVAVPLTMVVVPVLVLLRPFNARRRPSRSLVLLAFLAGNIFLLAVRPEVRLQLLQGRPRQMAEQFYSFFYGTLAPAVPLHAQKYLPLPLIGWLRAGQLGSALEGDVLLSIYEVARDFNCVGGMLFPVFCFAYIPLLALVALVGVALPAQYVGDEGVSLRELRTGALLVLSLLAAGIVGGVYWRSQSSSGLGELRW